jgi:sensor c-di-GMP phosphodiesterase-like protein
VLARWIREDGTIIPPMNFIPLAESSGRIEAMTWLILWAALKDMYPGFERTSFSNCPST